MNGNFSEIIVDKFTKKFIVSYKGLKGAGKTAVLKYSPVLFKRWYFSALVNETTLSPSFILNASAGVNKSILAPSITPQLAGAHFKGFSIKENRYDIHSHPVVSDLTILLDFCAPDVELDENDHIAPQLAAKISNFLSLCDPYYIEYLAAAAFELKLLRKSDAIYSNKAAVSNNYTLFKRLNQEESLKKIVAATVKLCSKNINAALPKKLPYVSESGIIELIKKPVPVDDIFKRIFSSFGVDIERLWDDYSECPGDPSQEQNAMLSSTFFLGVVLDKWFITPFGEYLKLIEPIYCFYYNFDEELSYLFDVIKAGGNVDAALFSPCAFYSFTPLGRRLFASEAGEQDKRKRPLIPVSELLGLLNFDETPDAPAQLGNTLTTREIYSFKVKLAEDKRYWRQIDAADYNSLHELHNEIAISFGLPLDGYSIFTDENLSPFSRYGAPNRKGERRKADKVTLDRLGLKKGDKLLYVSVAGKKLEIELMKRIPQRRSAHYPQTVRLSKYMRMREEEQDS